MLKETQSLLCGESVRLAPIVQRQESGVMLNESLLVCDGNPSYSRLSLSVQAQELIFLPHTAPLSLKSRGKWTREHKGATNIYTINQSFPHAPYSSPAQSVATAGCGASWRHGARDSWVSESTNSAMLGKRRAMGCHIIPSFFWQDLLSLDTTDDPFQIRSVVGYIQLLVLLRFCNKC